LAECTDVADVVFSDMMASESHIDDFYVPVIKSEEKPAIVNRIASTE